MKHNIENGVLTLYLEGELNSYNSEDVEKEIDAIIACPRIVGYCYTQITDVEQEKNGIYRYDRTTKFDTERLRAIFAKIPSQISIEKK